MRFHEKVVIVTGATSGMGRVMAKEFAAEGAKVVCVGRNVERGNAVVQDIKANGGEAIFVATDMAKEEALDLLINETINQYGKIDVLVNNAGIAYFSSLENHEQNKWDEVVDVNLRGPYLLCKKTMPYLIKSKGNIVNISSIAGLKSLSGAYAYCPSKAAVNSLTKLLAFDYAKQGVRVNAICPGTIETEIFAAVTEEALEKAKASIPVGRFGQSEEITKAVLFMASDDASYITGQTLAVDGGRTL